ncbi:hypothetical protein FALCPG4_015989 [Fusarium falciforme]
MSILEQKESKLWPTGDKTDRITKNAQDCFESYQWRLLAPVFTKDTFHHELHEKVPLPFITKVDPNLGGHFSTVYEVELHWAHQDVITPEKPKQNLKVALKEINKTENKWFIREMKVLEVIQHIQHTHLIRPIASYKKGPDGRGCFLFPWADKGNLKTFWKRQENQKGVMSLEGESAHHLMIWTLNQMLGLCSAIAELHKPRPSHDFPSQRMVHCRHGDIKPENILVFRKGESEVLCIADIGLGKFHEKATEFRKAGNIYTDTTTGTTRYLPPEFRSTKQIPRVHDIWSLGCLFLEFIIWAAWGNDGLDKFIQLDIAEFWQQKNKTRHIHESVERWIGQMRYVFQTDTHETALGDILEMIRLRMLVMEETRETSENIREELQDIVTRAQCDETYRLDAALCSKIQKHGPPDANPGSQNEAREEV